MIRLVIILVLGYLFVVLGAIAWYLRQRSRR
jgi:hypothetical protein